MTSIKKENSNSGNRHTPYHRLHLARARALGIHKSYKSYEVYNVIWLLKGEKKMAREGTTRIDVVIVVFVLIAIIVSAGTLFYVTDVMGKTGTLTDSVADLTTSVGELTATTGDLASTLGELAAVVGEYEDAIAALEASLEALTLRIEDIERALRPELIVIGTTDKITVLDVAKAYDFYTWEVFTNIGEGLMKYIPGTTDLEFGIAEDYTLSPDGLNYTFKLREGMYFTDGAPLDAAAVKWSIDRVVSLNLDPVGLITAYVDRVEVLDTLTVSFILKQRVAFFLDATAMAACYFPVSSKTFPVDRQFEAVTGHYGPYKIRRWVRDVELVLDANPYYLGTPPETETIIVRFFADAASMRLAVEAGEIDVAWRTLRPVDVVDLKAEGVLTVDEVPGPYIRYIVCRCNMTPFDDVQLRLAVAAAIDRDRICAEAWKGTVSPLYSMVPMGMFSHIDAFGERNLTLAQELLTAAGYSTTNKFAFDLWYTPTHYGDPEVDVATIMKEDLEETGMMTVTLKSAEWATYAAVYISAGTMPIFLLGWYPDFIDPDNYLTPFLYSEISMHLGVFYNNTVMDTLLLDAMGEMNVTRRQELYEDAQELLAEEAPVIPFFQGVLTAVYWPEIRGVVLDPTMLLRYYLLYRE